MGSGANKERKRHNQGFLINKLKTEEQENYRKRFFKELSKEFDD